MTEVRYSVPDISCEHCVNAISSEVEKVPGVLDVAVNIETKLVTISGETLDDLALREAIDEAGYAVAG